MNWTCTVCFCDGFEPNLWKCNVCRVCFHDIAQHKRDSQEIEEEPLLQKCENVSEVETINENVSVETINENESESGIESEQGQATDIEDIKVINGENKQNQEMEIDPLKRVDVEKVRTRSASVSILKEMDSLEVLSSQRERASSGVSV